MRTIFTDTSFFIALIDRDDQYSSVARSFALFNNYPLLTSSAIVLEVGAFFSRAPLRTYFRSFLNLLAASPIEVIHIDQELQRRGIEMFLARPDKDWSLADCLSFIVMADRGIVEAVTTDIHFEQAQFAALLRGRLPTS